MEGRRYNVWELGPRAIREHGNRDWGMRVRLGPDADCSRSRKASSASAMPAGVRKTTARQLLAFSHPGGQVGLPPAIPTDASTGFPVIAHRSAGVLFGRPESDRFILVRAEETASCGLDGAKAKLAQRAKVGYCPRRTLATHAAVPPMYELGKFANDKARGSVLRKRAGPWAARLSGVYL